MKIALTAPQKPNSLWRVEILLALSRGAELGRFGVPRALCGQNARAAGLHFSDKALARQRANQLTHFQCEQRACQLRDRKLRAFRERIDLLGRIGGEQLEHSSLMLG